MGGGGAAWYGLSGALSGASWMYYLGAFTLDVLPGRVRVVLPTERPPGPLWAGAHGTSSECTPTVPSGVDLSPPVIISWGRSFPLYATCAKKWLKWFFGLIVCSPATYCVCPEVAGAGHSHTFHLTFHWVCSSQASTPG